MVKKPNNENNENANSDDDDFDIDITPDISALKIFRNV
jgi:hypothetical protein